MKRIESRSTIDAEQAESGWGYRIEWTLNHTLLLVFLSLTFGTMGDGGVVEPLMLPLTMVIAVWAGLRLRLRGALGVMIILLLFVAYAWVSRIGVFLVGTGAEHLFFAVGLLAIFAAVSFLSAIVAGYHLRSADLAIGREHMLHTVLDSLPIGVWVRSPGGETVFVNERWASFSLMSVDEIMNSASTEAPIDLGAQWESERQALLSGDAGGVRCQRVDLTDHTGTHCCMTLLTLRMYIDDVSGIGTVSLLVDETALRLYEQRIQVSEHRLRMALDNAEMAFWERDLLNQTIYCDASWYRMLDVAQAEVVDEWQELQRRMHPDDRLSVLGAYRAFSEDGSELLELDYRLRQGAGAYIWVQERVIALERDGAGRVKRMMGTMQDISARKRNELDLQHAKERAEVGDRAKGQFIATVSHEIRTPLNAIIGLSSVLSESDLDAEQLDLSQTIYTSGNSLLLLVNDILDFSKIEAGRLELEVQEFPLVGSFEACIKLFKPRAVERRVALKLSLDSGLTEFAMGDMERLRQVIQNLLANALKFTEQGEVEIAVKPVTLEQLPVERRPDPLETIGFLDQVDHDYLEVLVRDTGIGIPKDRQRDLFEAFSQVDASTTRKYGGTGLGLAICQRLVNSMGGNIWVESDAGAGAEFGFVVRTQFIRDSAPVLEHSIDRVEKMAKEHPCAILIVGNRLEVEPLLRACRKLGYAPHHAPDYDVSGDAFQRRRYGLAFICMSDEGKALALSRTLSGATGAKRPALILGVVPEGQTVSKKRCKLVGMQRLIEGKLDPMIIRDVLLDVLGAHD